MIIHVSSPQMQGGLTSVPLSDAGGITQFGLCLQSLAPGADRGKRHWHSAEDELALILEGHPTPIEDHEPRLRPGESLGWPHGAGQAHGLENRSQSCLVLGKRHARDVVLSPDHDLAAHNDGSARRFPHADGHPRREA